MGRCAGVSLSFCYYLFLFFFSSSVHGASKSSQLPRGQKDIMLALSKNISTLSPHGEWNTTKPNPCDWTGVDCSSTGSSTKVIGLSLSGLGLSTSNASFFDNLCHLDTLQSLDLSNNFLTSIPSSSSSCFGLSRLKSLNLSNNSLTGPLPSLSAFPALEHLDLSFNRLEGTVDTQLDKLVLLRSLNLSTNNFRAPVPRDVGGGRVSSLEELVLSHNRFEGQIPSETFSHGNLTLLDLSWNCLNGSLPGDIGRLSKLENLLLSSNSLTGEIPANLSKITTLLRFAANQNQFSGAIPSNIARHLNVLDLSYNQLSEKIPADILSYPTLKSVDLTSNYLRGTMPQSLSPKLYRLRLGENWLDGNIPQEIGQLSNLIYLELNGNRLHGQIPKQLGNCKKLSLLNLASNRLQGGLPTELGKLSQLVVMQLQGNNLNGSIPDEFSKLGHLNTLNLSRNSLTGAIPTSISGLNKLSLLNLDDNKLNGSIPDTISEMAFLIELQLGNNSLSGAIPGMPSGLSTALNLSHNLFSGPLPSYLGNLPQLEILDLSNNNFTGEVPSSFNQLRSLTQLDLSNNHLSGMLPQLPKAANIDISGNNGLDHSTSSPAVLPKKKSYAVLSVIMAVIASVLGLSFIAASLLFLVSRRFYGVKTKMLQSDENSSLIKNGCFITSNSIHRSNIDFARAMEAVGNPGNITLRTRFATYYKVVMPSGVSYSVKKLQRGDKIFQTGSYSKFEQELDVLGRLSNSNVMVPLSYVLTRDSAYLFYEHVHKGTVFDFLHKGSDGALDWPSRYSIALKVAQGLTFLHGCTQPVLLLDLTTKTIHLKSLKEPQIGDIELGKFIDPSKSPGSLSSIAGSVGYIPPEYPYTMRVTMAGNVYSFGVILLELLTGKQPVTDGIELAKWTLIHSAKFDEGDQILDSSISRTSLAVHSQMLSVLTVALSCVSSSPGARPKMRNVLRMLFHAR